MAASPCPNPKKRSSRSGEVGGCVCSLDFRPSRFFGCNVEKVLAEFFTCGDPRLAGMPDAFWDLTQGTIRPILDDRVVIEAQFSPRIGKGQVTMTLFFRLPSTDGAMVERVLCALDRRTSSSSYHRFGEGNEVASLRGHTRVRTSIVGEDKGESFLMTTLVLSVRALTDSKNVEDQTSSSSYPAGEKPARLRPKQGF